MRARDGRAAVDVRDARFHTSIAVAAQQSGSKSCGVYCIERAPGASLQEEHPDCGGAAAAHYAAVKMPRQRSEAVA